MKNKRIDLLLYLDIPVNFDEEIEIISVLDGEIAVPCSLKSAYAGLNPKRRVFMS
jgi:hypothetical protein